MPEALVSPRAAEIAANDYSSALSCSLSTFWFRTTLVRELFDLIRLQAAAVRLQLCSHDLHQEVEAEDVHKGHGKDGRIREVDDSAKAGSGTDNDKDAKDQLEDQFCRHAFTEQIRPNFQPVVRP